MDNKRIIEVNGVKLEVDLSTAKRIDEFRVGDNVKVLRKEYSGYKVDAGVIVEFVNFKEYPTIVIATYSNAYGHNTNIDFLYYNSETKDVEIMGCLEHELKLEKSTVIDKFNNDIESKKREIDTLVAKRDYFEKYFKKYFESKEV